MALFPCDVCKKRYVGTGNLAYVGWMAGGFSERARYRLCQPHVTALTELLELHMVCIQVGDQLVGDDTELPAECQRCHLEPGTVTWFAQVYDRRQDMHQYATVRCAKCQPVTEQSMRPEAIQSRQVA